MAVAVPVGAKPRKPYLYPVLVLLAALAFSLLFAVVNAANYNWLSPRFEQASSHTVWGILQRLYLVIPGTALVLWRPRQIGFQVGKIFQYKKMLLIMLVANVAVISGYMLLAGPTLYSRLDLLVNEVITVPLVEEVMWRGIVFAALLAALRRRLPEQTSATLAALYSGVCFGLLHSANALFGYPLAFVALQTLSATIWGVMYGIARARTGSVYPPIVLHAAMNLVVVALG